jgi:hypothetical protein
MASNKQINKEKTNGNTGTPKPKEFATNRPTAQLGWL